METGFEIYSIINTVVSLVLGGGWFLHWRASRRKADGEAKQTEAQANKEAQEYYNTTLADVNNTLKEVRAERDHYKDDRNALRKENEMMVEKYNELQRKLAEIEIEYKRDIFRLGRRLDCISPLLCGVAGCPHRKKVNIIDDGGTLNVPSTNDGFNTEADNGNHNGEPSDIDPIESNDI